MMRVTTLVPAALLLATLSACEPVPPCGDLTFTGTEVDGSSSNGIDMNVSFDFDPAECGSNCTCNLVAYVQIVRTVDLEDFNYLYPSSEKADRATADGWYIDRLANRIWGYYGRNDDGSFASTLDPGSDTDPAILFDSPRRPESEPWLHIWWEAVSVPVCIDPDSACANRLAGAYFWSWIVDAAGVVTGIVKGTAWDPLPAAFDAAVAEWNVQAPTLGKNNFPAFTWMTP
jgi:hypothetical protein